MQAICDFVRNHIVFGYENARPTKTAWEAFQERRGVCRDYTHLAVTFCRCTNIPARYCAGYLGDMGTAPPYGVMDFAAWFEVYLDGAGYTFDAALRPRSSLGLQHSVPCHAPSLAASANRIPPGRNCRRQRTSRVGATPRRGSVLAANYFTSVLMITESGWPWRHLKYSLCSVTFSFGNST